MNTIEEIATNQATDSAPSSEGSSIRYCRSCGHPMIGTPALQSGEGGSVLHLRCFARRVSSGCYVAECIDLDISAEAATLEGAIVGLQDAMHGYLLVVFESQDTNAAENVLRRSPLGHRIRYYFEYLKYWVSAKVLPPHGRTAKKFYQFPGFTRSHCGI